MAWNFPNSPAENQEYIAPNGYVYRYNAPAWGLQGSGGSTGATGATGPTGPQGLPSQVSVSDAAPSSPVAGQMWWCSLDGNLYIYYNDGNTSQWVQANAIGT